MGSGFGDLTVSDHEYLVGRDDRGEPVDEDQQRCAFCGSFVVACDCCLVERSRASSKIRNPGRAAPPDR